MKKSISFLLMTMTALSLTAADELAIAKSALRDGFWEIARMHAQLAGGEEGRLIVLESLANEGKWEEVGSELARAAYPTNENAYVYYRAAAEGRLDDALEALKQTSAQAGDAETKMLEADILVAKNDRPAAVELWREVASSSNVNERAFAVACLNLGEVAALRNAYGRTITLQLKRRVGLRLGIELLHTPDSEAEGESLIRAIAADRPEEDGAMDAFRAIAVAAAKKREWKRADKIYADLIEIWPMATKSFSVREGRGETLFRIGRHEDALAYFEAAEKLAGDDSQRARTVLRQADVLSDLGRGEEAMRRYRIVLEKYSATETAMLLKRLVELREREAKGRELYKAYQFEEAKKAFAEVAASDPARKARMSFLEVLCLYGLGKDDTALAKAWDIAETCEEPSVRADAMLWLAKYTYNNGEWIDSSKLFLSFAEERSTHTLAPVALLWAARATFAAGDYVQTIQIATKLVERYPNSEVVLPILLLQAEALVASARFDEAIVILDRAALTSDQSDRFRARLLRANALFAMGADNSVRYQAAVEAYQAILLDEELDADQRLAASYRLARALEKLKRYEEAIDQYYSHVVFAYDSGRRRGEQFSDDAGAMFVQAAFWLADECIRHGKDSSAIDVLNFVVNSGLPAAEQAERRKAEIGKKGFFK